MLWDRAYIFGFAVSRRNRGPLSWGIVQTYLPATVAIEIMTKSYLISKAAGILVGVLSLACLNATEVLADRPNIVMAFADDWGMYASAYAAIEPAGLHEFVSTPNFDAVATEGVLFTRAFVSAPSCTPCRSSLLSGQPFWRCERASVLRGAIWDFSIPAYPLLLQDDGYRIGHTYKVWSPGTPADAPHGGKKTKFQNHGGKFNGFSQNVMKSDDHEAAKKQLLDEVRMNVRSFLDADDDGKLDDADAPFCYWLGPTNTHRAWIAGSGKKLWNIDPDDLKGRLPPYLPDVHTIREDMADYLGEAQAFDAALGVLIEELKRVGTYDDTLLVVSGDHGVPGVSRGKCNLYDAGTRVPLAIRWPDGIETPGRVVDDFVSLPDLAPTFMEVAEVEPPKTMIAKSLVPVLKSDKSGQVDPSRDAVYTGRERHVAEARTDFKPYPHRALRTDQYLYMINFEPDRWPMGTAPGFGLAVSNTPGSDVPADLPDEQQLRTNTRSAFPDMDASPTKAWIALHRMQAPDAFDKAFGQRPRVELYDIKADPHCMENLSGNRNLAEVERALNFRLMDYLDTTGDPRVSDDVIYERSPYTDEPN